MIYLKVFPEHISYEDKVNRGGESFKIPNVSYCVDADDIHFNPYNTVEFYVGNITEPQTVKIYTDDSTSIDITVSEGNKWYSYLVTLNKRLYRVEGDSVKKVVVKADINIDSDTIIPTSTVEASFKGSNTSNVTDMNSMFSGCNSLKSLDLSGLDTSKVTSMSSMFNGCNSLTSLDLSGWNTSNVTSMYSMFFDCSGLTSLDLRNFNTSKVTDMNGMFINCCNLTSLDVSNFDISNVTSMFQMFYGCSGLTSLDLSGLDMSNVTDMTNMFDGCGSLDTIKMIGCNQTTIDKIKAVKPSGATIVTGQTI